MLYLMNNVKKDLYSLPAWLVAGEAAKTRWMGTEPRCSTWSVGV